MKPPAWTIEAENLARVYGMGSSQIRALDGISLRVARGNYIALMGASGCGKSTLLHLLGCLDTPTAGRYCLEGQEVGALPDGERSRLRGEIIGFVFQNFNLLPGYTALENVALPLLYSRQASREQAERRAGQALERVGLAERRYHRPGELSGGQRQRVAIARALIREPRLLLADEPTGSLDSATGQEILVLLEELWREGRTLVLVTHDSATAARAQRVLVMKDGRLIGEGDQNVI